MRLVGRSPTATEGQLVDVGGHSLYLETRGTGQPAVVCEPGTWDIGLSWSLVAPDVATLSTVCTYDRAGIGRSDRVTKPRTADVMAAELRTLLDRGGVTPPYVLIAHSFGGIVALFFARRYPEDLAGLVLVDSAHPDQFRRFPRRILDAQDELYGQQVAFLETIDTQLRSGSLDPAMLPLPVDLPDDVIEAYRATFAPDRSPIPAMIAELQGVNTSHALLRTEGLPDLGDRPLRVLSHGVPAPLPPQFAGDEQLATDHEEAWQELQRDLAQLSRDARQRVVPSAGHMIHHESPQVVVDAVRDVLDRLHDTEDPDHG